LKLGDIDPCKNRWLSFIVVYEFTVIIDYPSYLIVLAGEEVRGIIGGHSVVE